MRIIAAPKSLLQCNHNSFVVRELSVNWQGPLEVGKPGERSAVASAETRCVHMYLDTD